MSDVRINALPTTATTFAADDYVAQDGTTNGTRKMLASISAAFNGWVPIEQAWTYASATTFTIVGDFTSIYSKGDRIKLTQTTVKYFYIIGVSFGGGNTTITITGGSDYTLANAAITANSFSKTTNPNGFPQFFNYTPTYTGFSADPTSNMVRFAIIGNLCKYYIRNGTAGTSNSNSFTISLPVTAATISNAVWEGIAAVTDLGSTQGPFGNLVIVSAGTTLSVQKDAIAPGWNNTAGKRVNAGNIEYEF